ncbi:hypothetical protein AW27_033875 (plasmid) [Streptomyces sp. PCS3-D2]|uniref:hypothetical protein n=1 Tax=Streptomyces sp. PCS3-D2 TaxID=1460244 RepID=UPI000563334F|nr:hypothetical protein [Streptomyces sp. PCS3-D2]WKV76603.1 hypothetical protein AW27_033875 [Streptomyces sp. PCS3-D2]
MERGATVSTATTELGRFLTITGQRFRTGQSAPEMFSPAVDKAWHELLGTPAYKALCLETAGQPIRHVANNGHGPIAWVAAYEEADGPLPEIWFTDADGNLDQGAIARYRETGTVVAEWDCGPAGGGDDVAPDQAETARR